jgi:isopenicillin-N epimerase
MLDPLDPAAIRRRYLLDPAVLYLNHGSFGACPAEVLEVQSEFRLRLEREPVRFFVRECEALLDEARDALAGLVGADPAELAFVASATHGVNAVLRSLEPDLRPGEELLTTDHAYNACRNALDFVAARTGARVVVARIPFPLASTEEAAAPVLAAVTPRTRLALLDHVTSATALILPVERLVPALEARGVACLVDGAHAPGMVPLDLRALGASYYVGNLHKWIGAPKGAGFLHARADRRDRIRPLSISHGANATRTDRSRFHLEFDWTGTGDPSPWLAVPAALRFLSSLLPGGLPALQTRNHELALAARVDLAAVLGVPLPCPDELIGAMASLPLPDGPLPAPAFDPLHDALFARGIEVPVHPFPAPPHRVIRISAAPYLGRGDFAPLHAALRELLPTR